MYECLGRAKCKIVCPKVGEVTGPRDTTPRGDKGFFSSFPNGGPLVWGKTTCKGVPSTLPTSSLTPCFQNTQSTDLKFRDPRDRGDGRRSGSVRWTQVDGVGTG